MAYINGLGGRSSMSSIYGNRNVLSGLASGMDTESMIENAISGYRMKMEKLVQQRTKTEWRQTAYRSIIDKMAAFTDKYTSYRSDTNLMSTGFFDSAVKVSTAGTHADKVSASGRSDSTIQILGVKRLATSATHSVSGLSGSGLPQINGDSSFKLTDERKIGKISGTMTINYGNNQQVDIEFGADEVYENAEQLAEAIKKKLSEQKISINSKPYQASEKIGVNVSGNSITFSDKGGAGNTVYISAASGDLKDNLNIKPDNEKKVTSFSAPADKLFMKGTVADLLAGKTMEVTLDGETRKITMPAKDKLTNRDDLVKHLQSELNKAFGDGRITVKNTATGADDIKLSFETQKGSSMSMKGEALKGLGFKKNVSSFVDTTRSVGDIWGDKLDWTKAPKAAAEGAVKDIKEKEENGKKVEYGVDAKGCVVKKADDGKFYRVDAQGTFLHDFKVNGVTVGQFNKDTELSTVLRAIGSNPDAGVDVTYSETTDRFLFTSKKSGAGGRVDFGDKDGLAAQMFNTQYKDSAVTTKSEAGQDAILSMKVNNEVLDGVKRSGNTFKVDGMEITLKETFGDYEVGMTELGAKEPHYVLANQATAEKEAVSFKSTSDADKIVDAVKAMVEDYNAMVEEMKKAFSELPNQKTNGAKYEPLTAKQMEGMTESEIKAYEEKAKQGILFADRDLSTLYDRLRRSISMVGQDAADMRDIGLSTSYSNGLTTLRLDENKLRSALGTDPDKVRDFFSKSTEGGATTNGLMQSLKEPLDIYGKVRGGKGVLVEKAGSPLASTTLYNNILQQEMNGYDKQISILEKKMNSQIDRYTKQFSKMEQLIATMNAQSSSLMGLMGGGGGGF